jgi:23S rRNA pseudouridine2605 synthase
LLLTNDGALARYMELPSTGWERKYRVRVLGDVDPAKLGRLAKGVTIKGVRYKSILAKMEKGEKAGGGANSWINVSLSEGKNREIRKVMEFLGLKVNRLIRTDYGPFSLGSLDRGDVLEIRHTILKKYLPDFFKADSKGDSERGWA